MQQGGCAFPINMTDNLEEKEKKCGQRRLQHIAINDVTVGSYHDHVLCGHSAKTLYCHTSCQIKFAIFLYPIF